MDVYFCLIILYTNNIMIIDPQELSYKLFEKELEGVIKCDQQGSILEANTEFLNMLGYNSVPELVSADNTHTPEHWQVIENDIIRNQVIRSGCSEKFHKEYYHKDGSLVYVEQILWMTKDMQGDAVIWGLVKNLSKEKIIQQKVAFLLDRLEKTDQVRNKVIENECRLIASEIHDSIGQQLTGISLELGRLKELVNPDEAVLQQIDKIVALTGESLDMARNICSDLRPLDDIAANGVQAVQLYVKKWEQRTGVATHFSSNLEYLGQPLNSTIYRIAQEALTNVTRHARATRVRISIHQDDKTLRLAVSDNGVGIPAHALDNPDSLGLIGMKERAESAGGNLSISAKQGTMVKAVFDMNKNRNDRA